MILRLLLAGGVCAAAVWAQTPVIRTETRTVLVETVVTGKKGDFVHGLTSRDFHVWQDGKEQTLTSVSENPQTTEPRFLVLFFDDTGMAPADKARARQEVARFIDANAAPGRQMAVVSYVDFLRVAQSFTDDAGTLKDALMRVERQASGTSGSAFASHNMLQALATLAKGLATLPGRKTIVFLTGGIAFTPDLKSQVAAVVDAAGKSGVAVYPAEVQPIQVTVDATATAAPRPSASPFGNRGRGLQGDSAPAAQVTPESQPLLDALANGTGGFFIRDAGSLLAGLQRIGEEQTEYYVLSFTPPESKEGNCHALRVKVDRGGANVRARSSYCSNPPVDLIGHADTAKQLEERAASGGAGNLKASVQLSYFYASAGVARVHLTMDMDMPPSASLELLGIATAEDGSAGARVSDTIRMDGQPVHYEKEFKIAPSAYRFTLAFRAGEAGFGKIETALNIPPWNGAELAVSSPVLSHETRAAADLGLLASLIGGDQAPLVAGATEYVPAGTTRFVKAETGFFYLEIYDPNPASVRVRVRVVDRANGQAKWDSGVTQPPPPAEGKAVIKAGAGLRINALGTGSYRVEVTATDGSGKQAESAADFEVE